MENLPCRAFTGKNIGVTHLTNGCYRLHPVEWNIGECLSRLRWRPTASQKKHRRAPCAIGKNRSPIFKKMLRNDGVRLEWPPEAGAI